eukprot:665330-Pelagomonas_calceolata.AAC.3
MVSVVITSTVVSHDFTDSGITVVPPPQRNNCPHFYLIFEKTNPASEHAPFAIAQRRTAEVLKS